MLVLGLVSVSLAHFGVIMPDKSMVMQGVVKFKGKPVANADVEVEYWNDDKKVAAPNDYFFTQVVKTDKNGVFTFAVPKAGWCRLS
jgi:uncharacterized GH25 family protein